MKLKPEELKEIIKESVKKVLEEVDRHRPGYYKDYEEKTGKKDRHSPDYYKKYREVKKQETLAQDDTGVEKPLKAKKKNNKDRHKPGYYHNYNQEHPERLERGYTKGYVDGKVSNGPEVKQNGNIWYDELGRPHSNDFYNPTMTDMIDDRMSDWHDDDWQEST